MENIIRANAGRIAELLAKDYDIIIKKTKENKLKILYYRPKNLKGEEK